ncbi:hypothetical protein [Thalassobacillus devorans]|uniref:hypothetical protein n=1 Tax=Thalassobacillus devorans TaxID=279813 RepID=UPI0004914019|nr:hypothetical protein [Thalassobacillus devorans]
MRFTRHSISTAGILESIMKGRRGESVRTYITNFGFVQGRPGDLEENDHSNLKPWSGEPACCCEPSNFIYLKEVIIHTFEGELIKVDHLVIYDEQLIGVMPGKLFEEGE